MLKQYLTKLIAAVTITVASVAITAGCAGETDDSADPPPPEEEDANIDESKQDAVGADAK
jgi:hypothetical protein